MVGLGLPVLLAVGLARRRYLVGLSERLGAAPRLESRPAWFHAASVGELRAFEPLARLLRAERPELDLSLSVTTPAGREAAAELRELLAAPAFQVPLDAALLPERALGRLRPRALVLVETELWPGLIAAAHRGRVPVALVNGRIEERSFRRYRRVRPLLEPALAGMASLSMRGDKDAERIVALGAVESRVAVTGNMKFDAAAGLAEAGEELTWAASAGLTRGRWLAFGSTAAGEEDRLLRVFAANCREEPELRCLLAPRRPDRWDEVARMVESHGLPLTRRSSFELAPSEPVPPGGVLLLDTVGELARLYRHADLVFVGGSLVPRGGQNLMEPAAAGRPVLFGPGVFNFEDARDALLDSGGGLQVQSEELEQRVRELLSDGERRRAMGEGARAAVLAGRGAARRTLERLLPLLDEGGRP